MQSSMLFCLLVLLSVCLSTTNAANCTEILKILSRQTMLQQLVIEEMNRVERGSGVQQIRVNKLGFRPYANSAHGGHSMIAMHDHANYKRVAGLGEFSASLNGWPFRTRHNDYRLVMPTKKNLADDYHATEPIPFPNVPRTVRRKETVDEQIDEMVEYFHAFITQNSTHREYDEWFKPILCYLEGHWTTPTTNLEEPFASDRHSIEANSWFDLQEKTRFTSFTGSKSNLENLAFLPTIIWNVTEEGEPVLAQWTYRILCHPLETKVPLSRFHTVDDLGVRLNKKSTMEEHKLSRAARFKLDPRLDMENDDISKKWTKTFLDTLMGEIPGLDNYRGNLNDTAFGITSYEIQDNVTEPLKVLNTAFYHRMYKTSKKGAQGLCDKHRSFADDHIFMAMTSNPRVPPVCTFFEGRDEMLDKKVKRVECQRWTYAIPLEIIYLTPLSTWNPYELDYKGDMYGDNIGPEAYTVRENGRNGAQNETHAFNGTNSRTYYMTPAEFFQGRGVNEETVKADTSNKNVGVLDKGGVLRIVGPSGVRIMSHLKDNKGTYRQRWPIMEVPGQSSPVWKELEALKDVLLGLKEDFEHAYYNQPPAKK